MAKNDQLGTAELGLLGMGRGGSPTEADIQRGISVAMAGVTGRDARHNPNALSPADPVRVAGAPTVVDGERGWAPAKPLAPPMGQDRMAQLADHFLPSARVERLRADWAKLTPTQQAELLSQNPEFRRVLGG